MKKIVLFLTVLLFVACKTASNETVTYQVKKSEVAATLKYLASDELQGRDSGSEGIEKAADYLEELLKKSNIKPYISAYKDTLSDYNTYYNVVGYLKGTDATLKNEWVILGAHYDHIGITEKGFEGDYINNGANDNASGTTILSEVAKYLGASKNNKRSVMFVFFSAEEKGLLGAKHLAKKLKEQNIDLYTLLNFEMLGVPMNYDFEMFLTGYNMSNMAQKINEYAGTNLVGMSEGAEKYNLFKASDNYPFYQTFKIPSQTVSAFDFSNFDYYHHPKDEFEEMDIEYMTRITQKILPVVDKMLNTDSKEIQLN